MVLALLKYGIFVGVLGVVHVVAVAGLRTSVSVEAVVSIKATVDIIAGVGVRYDVAVEASLFVLDVLGLIVDFKKKCCSCCSICIWVEMIRMGNMHFLCHFLSVYMDHGGLESK